ncbi:cyclin-dependent kinase inhibitor 1C-like [Polyodon spathula]|uniref:cyclin-dependent kinase inhibitor 1C-like n=1 Tax=Polyodon spathula TaxID=7913 RepID=UPI001B7DB297|nr:cyclin-dependent kinase inhibitor 1C-like [Polyodon spathula]
MSSVQLSSTSLDRLVARRTFPLHARTGVCRNLFGPIDHDELNREMKSKLREISERDQHRWNFNFETSTPLEGGQYEWKESEADATPGFYRESIQMGKTRITVPVRAKTSLDTTKNSMDSNSSQELSSPSSQENDRLSSLDSIVRSGETNQENRSDKLNSGIKASKSDPCTSRKRVSASSAPTHITDFFVKRKRILECKQSENGSPSAAAIATEQTPRKRIR